MNRRNALAGLAGIFAAGFAPAAVGSWVLMPTRRIAVPGHPIFQGGLGEFEHIKIRVRTAPALPCFIRYVLGDETVTQRFGVMDGVLVPARARAISVGWDEAQ